MNNTKANLFIFFFLIAFTAIIAQTKKVPVKNNAPLRSTTLLDTPRYQPAVKIPTVSYGLAYDSVVKYFLPQVGRPMLVETAEFWKSFLLRQFDVTLIKGYVLDSLPLKPLK